ncbi:opine dehydrogenase [Peptoclostridium litorale DSM 5388]|uniref:Opine dehydrogenase Odh n=1 Tax=Peptoclostridium litorale DSM 5388 TaxID=1121324 RepID=A0A069RIJ0_PEPLI|nr:NAD/NADP octopine/nopaline dehydrogenase family protein [Peptoclostridium litorale]KDR95970.1 opine dehydrogenase Odh [Peptoclostridium litorale DSM 5388]SIO08962.1 opine dehydrogenase [Peptoclostridium litorale DSM 5388]
MKKKITIIGGGNGAYAAAADLALSGHQITLYADEGHKKNIEQLLSSKTIRLSGAGKNGHAKLHNVTTDISEALSDADIIMPVIPAYSQKNFALDIAPHIRRGHKIVLTPGSSGGALLVARMLHEMGKLEGVKIAEMHTLPYAARKTGPEDVEIMLECKKMFFAAFPAKYNHEMHALVSSVYPAVELVSDVLESSLNNGNPISHVAPVILNAGKIEYCNGEHYHYKEGITPSVARVVEKIDFERQLICRKLGYKTIPVKERLHLMGYVPKRDTLYESYRDKVFNPLFKGPKDLKSRYLTEDVPYSMVLFSSIASQIGISTPLMDSVITLASALNGEDYFKIGRKVGSIGIEGMGISQIKRFLHEGY